MPTSHSVLIVEDEAAIRDVFGELLRSEGHEVTLAANGEVALRLLREGARPCLMIVDMLMPVMDGRGFASRVAVHPEFATIPLLVMSAQPDRGRYSTPDGARARLTKPAPLEAVLSAVERHCGRARNSQTRHQRKPVQAGAH